MSWPIEMLAERLYWTWCEYEMQTRHVSHPRWFVADDEIRAYWHGVAEDVLQREAAKEWA